MRGASVENRGKGHGEGAGLDNHFLLPADPAQLSGLRRRVEPPVAAGQQHGRPHVFLHVLRVVHAQDLGQRPVGHIGVVHVPAAAIALPALRKVVPEAEGADGHLRRLQQEGDEFNDLGVAEQIADALALEDVDAPVLVGVLIGPLH